jgi:putative transposase
VTDTISDVAATAAEDEGPPAGVSAVDQQQLAEQLLAQAREQGVELVGPGGLLNQLTKKVLETALEAEMSDPLGYDKHHPAGRNHGNSRNGIRSKTVLTEIGPVEIEVPRDVDASFQPKIVRKRQRRLTGVDQIVLSLSARGLTTGELGALRGGLRGGGVERDSLQDHRPGAGGDGWLVGSTTGLGVSGDLHRRDRGEGPRRAGPQQADRCGHRSA